MFNLTPKILNAIANTAPVIISQAEERIRNQGDEHITYAPRKKGTAPTLQGFINFFTVANDINDDTIVITVSNMKDYAIFHQLGTRRIPQRPMVRVTPENAREFAKELVNNFNFKER